MLYVIGVSHKTAPIALRERLAVAPERVAERLDGLLENEGITEAVLLATCNRSEVYAIADAPAKRLLIEWLGVPKTGPGERCLHYTHEGGRAARHLFRVAAGLESMVLGEAQVLGQVKAAYLAAHRAAAVGPELHRLFQYAFETAKAIRGDASLNTPRSLPYAAMKLARARLGNLRGKTALLIGAGVTIETLAFHLRAQGIGRLLIANRSRSAAETLALTYGGEALGLADIPAALAKADVAASATASEVPLLDRAAFALRANDTPLLLLDLAVPRDVAPEVAALSGVELVGVDDLAATIAASAEMRYTALGEAEQAVERALSAWHKARRIQMAVPTICALRAEAAGLRRQTLAEARRVAIARGSDAALEYLAATLANRLIHAPTVRLREAAAGDDGELIAAARALFDLDSQAERSDSEAA
jgi:glutamyl-tRNA reductase